MKLLFVCTHNACRSILAESITRRLANARIDVASAGSAPAGRIHPTTLQYLRSIGHPVDGLSSKGFDELGEFAPDVVITVCDTAASETCPVWLINDAITAHWGLPDPSQMEGSDADRLAAFESVARILENRINRLLNQPFESTNDSELTNLLNGLGRI
jgi:arsenate reductase